MRILENLKWLFNHPPTNITSDVPEDAVCDYCGDKTNIVYSSSGPFCFCWLCLKKTMDTILKPKDETSTDTKKTN